jgi:hypothetical protein
MSSKGDLTIHGGTRRHWCMKRGTSNWPVIAVWEWVLALVSWPHVRDIRVTGHKMVSCCSALPGVTFEFRESLRPKRALVLCFALLCFGAYFKSPQTRVTDLTPWQQNQTNVCSNLDSVTNYVTVFVTLLLLLVRCVLLNLSQYGPFCICYLNRSQRLSPGLTHNVH